MPAGEKRIVDRPREVKIDVGTPLVGSMRTMHVNRFAVQHQADHVLMHFAYVDEGGFMYDLYSCAMPKDDMRRCQERLLSYLGKTGPIPPSETSEWHPPLERRRIETCSFIHMARSENRAEILLCNFSAGGLLQKIRDASGLVSVTPDVIATLACALPLQQRFVIALYPEAESGDVR
jgi:hypothetical protein